MLNRYKIPLIILLSTTVGFVSAKLISRWEKTHVNVFEKTVHEAPGIKWVKNQDSVNMVFPLTVEGDLFFAGERVPLEDDEVRERLDRELQINAYWQSNTILSMKLANRYFDEIEKILVEEGVPTDFKYLPLIESGFRDVVSPAGAAGFWQFLSGTGRNFGLEINDAIDERYHLQKSTRAACKYLKDAKERLGSWSLAAAAYNFGTDGISSKLQAQQVNNYYDLFLTQETSRYVFRMLAMKVIFSNPQKAGFYLKEADLYQPFSYNEITVDSTISDITSFAKNYNLNYKDIKVLNSWLRSTHLPNKSKKTYQIKITNK